MKLLLAIWCAAVLLTLPSCTGISYPLSVVDSPFGIEYTLENAGVVDMTVSNCYMYKVRTLIDSEYMEAGTHVTSWDLLDDGGNYPGDGVYTVEVFLEGERVYLLVLEVVL